MKEIDRLYTRWPFFGSRKILGELRRAGHDINRKRVQRLMRAIETVTAAGVHTPDLGGKATTAEVTRAVCGVLRD